MCDVSWHDGPDAYTETWRTARKEHDCCACGETIAPGHRYHVVSGIWDGTPARFKHCARCWSLFEAIQRRSGELVDLDLYCGETWEDAFGDEGPSELAFLTADEAQALPGVAG